jgi:hypothetical protein
MLCPTLSHLLSNYFSGLLLQDENQMFPIEHLDQFYIGAMTDVVQQSYYLFLKDFCTRVSSPWKNFLKKLSVNAPRVIDEKHFTTSDEAFAWWFLKYRFQDEKKIVDEIKNTVGGVSAWTEQNKKFARSGPQYSKLFEAEYEAIHAKIVAVRKDPDKKKYLDDIFLKQSLKKLNNKLNQNVELLPYPVFLLRLISLLTETMLIMKRNIKNNMQQFELLTDFTSFLAFGIHYKSLHVT